MNVSESVSPDTGEECEKGAKPGKEKREKESARWKRRESDRRNAPRVFRAYMLSWLSTSEEYDGGDVSLNI